MPTGVTISGMKNSTRKKLRARIGWPQSSASPSPSRELHGHADDHVKQRVDDGAWNATRRKCEDRNDGETKCE